MREVQEAGYVLGNIETKTSMSPRARLQSVFQAKLLALDMKALPEDADVDVLIVYVSKSKRNQNPTNNQYYIKCPYFGLSSCTKTFCVAKKWGDMHPLNNDGTSKQISVHWYSHFKGLYNTKEIPPLVLKMADNHMHNVYCHHMIKHGGNNFSYFDYDVTNKRSELIKADANVKKARVEMKLT